MTVPLRIAHAIRSTGFAGVERYVCTAARRQHQLGHRVTVIGGDTDRMSAELADQGIAWFPAATVTQVWRRLQSVKDLQIVHAHMTAGELAAALGAPRTAQIISTRHFAATRGSTWVSRSASKAITRRVTTQIAISNFVSDTVEGDCVVVHPGAPAVDVPTDADAREKVVLVAQRFEVEKRTDLALRAWAASGLDQYGWRLQLAGSGALEGELRRLTAELGIAASTDFIGVRSDLDQRLRTASILLAPRHDEPFGLSVVEAMAAGLPIAAGAGGGHDETVGSCPDAVLLPRDDVTACGQLLRQLALDVQRRNRYGADLQRIQRLNFDGDRQVDALIEVYRRALTQ